MLGSSVADGQLDAFTTLPRTEAGMTQSEVAGRLRRPQSFVSKCESGERRVDVIELQDFASIYGKSVSDFL